MTPCLAQTAEYNARCSVTRAMEAFGVRGHQTKRLQFELMLTYSVLI